jgi:hypothetical protein
MLSLILATVNQKDKQAGETEQAFRLRILISLDKLPDSAWSALPVPVQEWANSAAVAVQTKKDIDPVPSAKPAQKAKGKATKAAPKAKDEPKAIEIVSQSEVDEVVESLVIAPVVDVVPDLQVPESMEDFAAAADEQQVPVIAVKPVTPATPSKPGAIVRFCELLLTNLDKKPAEICQLIATEGYAISSKTATQLEVNARRVLRICKASGFLVGPILSHRLLKGS